ncbi:MAG: UDP-N-acetylmuramoyl-tripeptide--D-alanyl-D-alanine ligase [Acidobacteriota bacterium]|nr:UDP-N-acetylmuramoyl-tripeptide--D-alanyl-D-alanine ligase [Acidobacteriota bacterium]
MKLTLGQVADWIHAEGDFTTNTVSVGYSIDSRTVSAGELFFAVRGERFDGHDFVEAALANGAVAAVVSMRWLAPEQMDPCKLLRVPDGSGEDGGTDGVLASLQRLAREVRRSWGGCVIGVTGSAGKTTTKEAVAQVLAVRRRVLKSQGNLNNGFGLPLQLLKLEPEHEVAVIEMGMNHAGEIAALAKIAEPNWGVVSNVGPVHLEFFPGGLEGIARAKYELIEALPEDGVAVLNCDDDWVAQFGDGRFGRDFGDSAVYYGVGKCAAVRAVEIAEEGLDGVTFTAVAYGETVTVRLRLMGRHNVMNVLAAIAVGVRSGMTLTECAAAVGELRAGNKRGEVVEWLGAKIVNDSYNSNPAALDAMVSALMSTPVADRGRRIVVAGEMLELGVAGEALHRGCGERMRNAGVDVVVGVQGLARALVEGAGGPALFLETSEEAGRWMRDTLREGDLVLLKGSRGVRLDRALDALGG